MYTLKLKYSINEFDEMKIIIYSYNVYIIILDKRCLKLTYISNKINTNIIEKNVDKNHTHYQLKYSLNK
jgi:hypothetical protein